MLIVNWTIILPISSTYNTSVVSAAYNANVQSQPTFTEGNLSKGKESDQ